MVMGLDQDTAREFGPGGPGPGFGPGGQGFGHGHGRGGRFGGPGGPRARRGALRYVLLDVLRDGPKHGYEIIKVLEERTYGQYAPSPGTVYPTLQYLDDLGLVRADAATERRVYHLTDAGRTEIESHREEVNSFWANFTGPGASAAYQHEIRFLRDELHDLGWTVWSGLRGSLGQGDHELIRGVRQAIERCQNEIRSMIADRATANPTASDTRPPFDEGEDA